MRILLDYRPALRQPTGVGEYAHRLAAALVPLLGHGDRLTLFSSSWKDRLRAGAVGGSDQVDVRVPVRWLNHAWHWWEWPPAEWFAGRVDVTQSLHPLLLPSRSAARFVTIHDLHFLDHPEDTGAEVRRDYPRLVASHAARADGILVVSEYVRTRVLRAFGVPEDRVVLCPPGAPDWRPRSSPTTPGPILFVGTIEPRKNVGGLLNAYRALVGLLPNAPPLALAGRVAPNGVSQLADVEAPPIAGRVRALGYVSDDDRQRLYREASLLVLPAYDEGFGIPVLEAMTIGVPVIGAARGALPEVIGDAGLLVEPDDPDALAAAMRDILVIPALRERLVEAGLRRAQAFRWESGARRVYDAYRAAIARRGGVRG